MRGKKRGKIDDTVRWKVIFIISKLQCSNVAAGGAETKPANGSTFISAMIIIRKHPFAPRRFRPAASPVRITRAHSARRVPRHHASACRHLEADAGGSAYFPSRSAIGAVNNVRRKRRRDAFSLKCLSALAVDCFRLRLSAAE